MTDGFSHTAAFSERVIGPGEVAAIDPRRSIVIGYIDPNSVQGSLDQCVAKVRADRGYFTYPGFTWFVGTLTQTLYNHCLAPNDRVADCMITGVNPPVAIVGPRSNHPGGVNLAMADGSTRFVTNTINREVWRALGTRAGGEIVSEP